MVHYHPSEETTPDTKHQREYEMETGSFFNAIMSGPNQEVPAVGMGCTITSLTDRSAGTIVRVTPRFVYVQLDTAERIDTNGMSECQEYAYTPNPEGEVIVFRKTKRGWRSACGNVLRIGYRRAYRDYSF